MGTARGVTHVLSILDPDWADPQAFLAIEPHHRNFACSNYTPPAALPTRKRSFLIGLPKTGCKPADGESGPARGLSRVKKPLSP